MISGYLFALGGFGDGCYLDTVECFDMYANEWSEVAPMQIARRWLAAVVLRDVIYVIGGCGLLVMQHQIMLRMVRVNRLVSSVVKHYAIGAGGLWFDFRAGQLRHSVANDTPPQRHFFGAVLRGRVE